jgi:hypothetical protein
MPSRDLRTDCAQITLKFLPMLGPESSFPAKVRLATQA